MTALDDVTAARTALHASTYFKPGSKGWAANRLNLCDQALARAIAGLQPPPSPPPPPPPDPPAALIDDMRATRMTAISSVGARVNPDGTPNGQPDDVVVRTQNPPGFWSSLLYTNDDITLIPDARYGQVYRFRTNGQSRNPYWSSATTCNSELEHDRSLTVGQWDWYGLAVQWEPGWDWSKVEWASIMQFGYPTISTPPLMLGAGYGDSFYVQRYTGLIVGNTIADMSGYELQTLGKQSVYVSRWLEFVVGVKWGSHGDGEIHVLTRCKDLSETAFTEVWTRVGVNTWQWGGALNVPQDTRGFGVVDKLDSYWGYRSGVTDANAPTTYIRHTGHVRAADKATVLAVMGA